MTKTGKMKKRSDRDSFRAKINRLADWMREH